MGQSKGGGYSKLPTTTPQQSSMLNQIMQMTAPNLNQAAAGFAQFLPGGGGGQAFMDAANKNFQQQSIPSILNAFGQNAKGSSALNQALAAGAGNMNIDLSALLQGNALQAAQGLGSLGLGQGQLGSQSQFAYLPKQLPFWQQLLPHLIGAGGTIGGGYLGRTVFPESVPNTPKSPLG